LSEEWICAVMETPRFPAIRTVQYANIDFSLWHRSRSQTIHSAPSFAFARSILSKPLAPHSKLQTSSRHIPHYQHSTSLTSELALTQKSWLLQAHSHPPPRAATHLRLRAPMLLGNGTSTLAFLSFAGHEAREAQRQGVCKRLTRRDL
jgi:hypothetical protein